MEEIGSQSIPDSCTRILFLDEIQEKDKSPVELKSHGKTMSKRAIRFRRFFAKFQVAVQSNVQSGVANLFSKK